MNKIKFTDGCPNQCDYCYEPKEIKTYDVDFIPDGFVQILDMNFLANPNAKDILEKLPKRPNGYELVCGVDFRRLTQDVCNLMKEKGFIKVRWAWDYSFCDQHKHQRIWRMFKKAGYRSEDLRVFMITNWKIPYIDCVKKLDLLKVWNVEVADCMFDGGYKIAKPSYWDIDQVKKFRAMCRKHNQLIIHKLDPELLKCK